MPATGRADMKLQELIEKGVETISVLYPFTEAREMVLRYLEDCQGIGRMTRLMEPDLVISSGSVSESLAAFQRMASGEPLQYVAGRADFYGRGFNVTPDVLIPRGETELLCRMVIERSSGVEDHLSILDLCTGSGCIAWTLALEVPMAKVTAMDISETALEVAASQDFSDEMSRTGAVSPVFVRGDVLSPGTLQLSSCGKFDVIVSNPPYVTESEKALMRRNVLDHEPHLALFVPDDDPLLFYRAVAAVASEHLRPGGLCIVEINESFGEATAAVFRSRGFSEVKVVRDLNMRDRFVYSIR